MKNMRGGAKHAGIEVTTVRQYSTQSTSVQLPTPQALLRLLLLSPVALELTGIHI